MNIIAARYALLSTFLFVAASCATDQKVNFNDCPQAVQKFVTEKAAGGKIGTVEKVSEDNKISYEAEITTKDGKGMEVVVTESGKLVATEWKIKLADCPDAVQKTINAKVGDGKMEVLEKVVAANGVVTYTAEIKPKKGDDMELEVSDKGRVIKFEKDND